MILAVLSDAYAVAAVEARKLLRDPTELFTRAVQPLLWLLAFGQSFTRLGTVPTGKTTYLAFLTPGVLAQSVLFTAIFYGIGVIWERDLGVLHKLLVSPASRTGLVLGKSLFAGVRGLVQASIVYAVAVALGVPLRSDPLAIGGVLAFVVLGSALFATFSLVVACLVRTRERFMGIGQLLTMPLFFASNAVYPITLMPPWLRAVAHANPLTYLVDAMRALMLEGGASELGIGVDLAVEAVAFAVLLAIASRLYPTLVR